MVEPPYGVIWNRLRAGKVLSFLVAGASAVGRASGASWNPSQPAFLASRRELSQYLANEISFPPTESRDRNDLDQVSRHYVDISGRHALRKCLRDVFAREFPHGALYGFLAGVPTPLVIVTTNYDILLGVL